MKFIFSFIIFVSPVFVQAQYLIEMKGAEESFRLFGYGEKIQKDWYSENQSSFDSFVFFPKLAKVEAEPSWDDRDLTLRLHWQQANEDRAEVFQNPKVQGLPVQSPELFLEQTEIVFSKAFKETLENWAELDKEAEVIVIDRSTRSLKRRSLSLQNIDWPRFEKAISGYFRSSAFDRQALEITIRSPNKALPFHEMKGKPLGQFVINTVLLERRPIDFVGVLPFVETFAEAKNESMAFYEAYELLDRALIDYLSGFQQWAWMNQIPNEIWRKNFLDRAFEIYFADAKQGGGNACRAYEVEILPFSGNIETDFEIPSLQETRLEIPFQIFEWE